MKYRPPRTEIGILSGVCPLLAVYGGLAARQRVESLLARPHRGEWFGVNIRSAGEAPPPKPRPGP